MALAQSEFRAGMPSVLFVHNGSPGRFAGLAAAMRSRGWTGYLLNGPIGNDLPGYQSARWKSADSTNAETSALFQTFGQHARNGADAAHCASALKQSGFSPDIIIGHPGWGEMLFLREIFPEAPQLQVAEYYYHNRGADVGFDPEFGTPGLEQSFAVHAKNATLALSYAHADRLVAPTEFQKNLLPIPMRMNCVTIHEGIDTELCSRIQNVEIKLKSGIILNQKNPIITFINRFFEPLRGFHSFVRCLPQLMEIVPDCHILLIGSDRSSGYGVKPGGTTWKQKYLSEVESRIDLSRMHFVDHVSHKDLVHILSLSWAHVYLTYPFVLSWSLLDAMACGCLIIGSDTPPVREIIKPGINGILVDFFDHQALAQSLATACEAPREFDHLRAAARDTITRGFDKETVCIPRWLQEVNNLAHRPLTA